MIRNLALYCMCLLSFCALDATTIPLKTGNWIFDRYRNVALDEFDYSYDIKRADHEQDMLELQDGSLWHVEPMYDETISFYKQKYPQENTLHMPSLFTEWQEGDIVIFHQVVNRPTLIAYNVTRDRLLDMMPVRAPLEPMLTIASINNTSDVSYRYNYSEKTGHIDRRKVVKKYAFIVLSDGSRWEGRPKKALRNWVEGDPVHIVKNTPYSGAKTHILMHFTATKEKPEAQAVFARLSVFRAG